MGQKYQSVWTALSHIVPFYCLIILVTWAVTRLTLLCFSDTIFPVKFGAFSISLLKFFFTITFGPFGPCRPWGLLNKLLINFFLKSIRVNYSLLNKELLKNFQIKNLMIDRPHSDCSSNTNFQESHFQELTKFRHSLALGSVHQYWVRLQPNLKPKLKKTPRTSSHRETSIPLGPFRVHHSNRWVLKSLKVDVESQIIFYLSIHQLRSSLYQ